MKPKPNARRSTNVEDARVPKGNSAGFFPGRELMTPQGQRLQLLLDLLSPQQRQNLGPRTNVIADEFAKTRDLRQQWGLEKLLWILNGRQGEFTPSGQ